MTLVGTANAQTHLQNSVHLLLRHLEAEGVDCLFGVPGGPLMPLFEAVAERGKIRSIIARHEEGAAFMADGYARVSGRLGVCCTTTGPGATNALTGLAVAHRDSVPVLLITAQIALSAFGKGAAQESSPMAVDIVDLFKGVTKASLMLMSPEKIADVTRFLLRTCLSGRPGPVHLSFPADMMKKPIPWDFRPPAQYRPVAEQYDRRSVREAAKLLLSAHYPAILAGYGVHLSGAFAELKKLAERLRIPVATTQKAKGVFPENHLLSLGVFGFAGSPRADAVLLAPETDLLLTVGTSLGELATHAWDARLGEGRKLVQIDIDPREIGKNYPVRCGLVGDARQVLLELLYQVDRDARWTESPPDLGRRLARVRGLKAMYDRFVEPQSVEDETLPLKPARVVAELRRALPDNAVVFVDIGNVMAWMLHYFTVREPGTFIINMGFGSMGHATAGVIGGKLAAPQKPVVAVVGDGAFAMNGMEVHTAVENNIPAVWVVLNNGGHGMVSLGEKTQFRGKFNTSTFRRPLDIAAMAEAMGATAFRARHPGEVERQVAAALKADRPVVIDVTIDPDAVPPLGMRLQTLEKFFSPSSSDTGVL